MVCISNIVAALASASIIGSAVARPGETHSRTQISRDIKKRGALALKAKRGLEACSNTLKARQLDEQAIARRSAKADKFRTARGISTSTPFLSRRNLTVLEDFETHNHNLTATYSDEMTPFSSNGSSCCILALEALTDFAATCSFFSCRGLHLIIWRSTNISWGFWMRLIALSLWSIVFSARDWMRFELKDGIM